MVGLSAVSLANLEMLSDFVWNMFYCLFECGDGIHVWSQHPSFSQVFLGVFNLFIAVTEYVCECACVHAHAHAHAHVSIDHAL
jgi:hypothetical protein